jgi:uncharacterized membrane protein
VTEATSEALKKRRNAPFLNGIPMSYPKASGESVTTEMVGYIQHIDMASLQSCAENAGGTVELAALPGTFVAPGRSLAYLASKSNDMSKFDLEQITRAFVIGDQRTFEEDPRYGLIVLSQIAGRSLSPAVNDPGTAIDIIGKLVRLFVLWTEPVTEDTAHKVLYDRVLVPEIAVRDMFDECLCAYPVKACMAFLSSVFLGKMIWTSHHVQPSLRGAPRPLI